MMILSMVTSTMISLNSPAFGESEAAQFICQQAQQGRRRLQDSVSLGLRGSGVFDELFSVAEMCACPNWDGSGADPVEPEAFAAAYRFLESLPPGTPAPTIGVEADGQLTFEWHKGPRRTLSVSVSPEGELHYSALLGGANRAFGTESFLGEVPKAIVELIRRTTQ